MLAIMLPHDTAGGSTPTPRIERPPSATITTAIAEQRDREHRGQHVGEHLAHHDADVRRALRAGGQHELALRPLERVGPRDAGEDRHRHDAEREDQHEQSLDRRRRMLVAGLVDRGGGEHGDERERQHELRDREQDVEERREDAVDAPPEVAGDQAERRRRRSDPNPTAPSADEHRVAGALGEVQEHVVAVAVEAERVARDLEEALARVAGERVVRSRSSGRASG